MTNPKERIAIFVDAGSMHHACKRAGYFIDWRKAKEHFTKDREFGGAYFYYVKPANVDSERQKFIDFLSHSDYVVRTKNIKPREEGRNSLSVDIVLDLLTTSDKWDTAYLFSGDGDFERSVETLRARGKKVYVVTAEGMLARELAYVSDKPVIWLNNPDIRQAIGRTDRSPDDKDNSEPEKELVAPSA